MTALTAHAKRYLQSALANNKAYEEVRDAIDTTAVGAVAGTGNTVAENVGKVHTTVITFTDTVVTMADETGVIAHGGLKVYDMPEGVVMFLGASTDIALTKSSAGIIDAFDGDMGVGTVTASNNNTLATTEQNIIPTTATPQATAGVTTADAQSTAVAVIDGSATAADVYINFLVDDVDHDIDATPANLILNGTLTLVWVHLGDN